MAEVTSRVRPRRTQEERSAATRAALLDATIECLIEVGYVGITTTQVAARAGVSRGAQVHHFPTKADLVTQAVQHLAARRGEELRAEAGRRLPAAGTGPERVEVAIELLWSAYSGPLFLATIELWVAARTDPGLWTHLQPVERRLGRAIRALCKELLGLDEASPAVDDAIDLTLELMRGMALGGARPRSDEDRPRRLLEAWKGHLATALEAAT